MSNIKEIILLLWEIITGRFLQPATVAADDRFAEQQQQMALRRMRRNGEL